VCCSVLQCVAVCCSVLQCVAECCSVLQCAAVCCRVCFLKKGDVLYWMQDFESSISQFTLNPMYIDMLKKIILFSYIEMYVGMYT